MDTPRSNVVHKVSSKESNFWVWFCTKLPKRLIYFCANQLVAYVTTHQLSNVVVGDVKAMDALGIYYNHFLTEERK